MVLYDNGKKKLKNYRRHLKINCIKALKKCFESLLFEKWTQMNYFLFMAEHFYSGKLLLWRKILCHLFLSCKTELKEEACISMMI